MAKDPDDTLTGDLFASPCQCLACCIERHEAEYPPMREPRTPGELIMGLAYEAAIRESLGSAIDETLTEAGLD
jgi:hypothetical protein